MKVVDTPFEGFDPGQRLRVTFEGTFLQKTPYGAMFKGRELSVPVPNDDVLTVELVEPEYEHGAMYVDADGVYFQYISPTAGWWYPGSAAKASPSRPHRPLRRLVPEAAE